MVNTANVIEGRKIEAHPLAAGELPVELVMQGETSYLAAVAIIGGVINTKDGQRRFQAGDYIVTDDPPTNAWAVNTQAFRAQYRPPSAQTAPHEVPDTAAPNVTANASAKGTRQRAAAKAAASKPKKRGAGPAMRLPGQPAPKSVPGRKVT